MTFKNPDFSSNSPYYDDFEETKNFLKILFKPGYAVQARELTQLQTILQSQIAKFADHVFQDGSQVFGGTIQITTAPYVRLEKYTHDTSAVTTNLTNDYLNTLPSNSLKVFSKSDTTFTELATIKVTYFESSDYSSADTSAVAFYNPVSVAEGQNGSFEMKSGYYIGSTSSGPFLKVITSTQRESNPVQYTVEPTGNGYLVTVDEGIFYIDGYFVKSEKQTLALFKASDLYESDFSIDTGLDYAWAARDVRLFNKPSHRIGYVITREIVTSVDDPTLNDPAKGFYNYTAPGADRYKISLDLQSIEYQSGVVDLDNYVTENFIQILRTTNGVVDYIKNKSSYAEILDLFARRTQDESGSYTIKPFLTEIKNHLRKDRYVLTVDTNTIEQIFSGTTPSININGYLWSTSIQSSSVYNPFTSASLLNEPFLVAKVVDIIPDYDISATVNNKSFKIVVELQNSYKFLGNVGSYYYKSSSSAAAVGINTTAVEIQIDSKGAYSISDTPTGDDTKMALSVQPGKAYVYGYEYETFAPRTVNYQINGNQSNTTVLTNLNVDFELGNYVKGTFAANDNSIVNYESLPLMDFIDVDTNTFLIYPSETTSIENSIYAWAPFKGTAELQGDMVDIALLIGDPNIENAVYPHESVIFVAPDNYETL